MEISKKVYLEDASREQIIEELKRRESLTTILINHSECASIKTSFGNISLEGKSIIFVIKESTSEKDTPSNSRNKTNVHTII